MTADRANTDRASRESPHADSGTPDPRTPAAPSVDIAERLRSFAETFDFHFRRLLLPKGDAPASLVEAVNYTALAPGKRIRPYLVVRSCELCGGSRDCAWAPAAAIECVHAFSLIHDDLPAMDDDDVRRGRPTCHKRFGEAVAILSGDALAILPFELLGRHVPDAGHAARMMLELASSAGWTGMIGGQAVDVLGQSQPPSAELAGYIHERKTASLFSAACRIGAMAAGAADAMVERFGRFGRHLGRAFQIADDVLDVEGSSESLGKPVGKDEGANKQSLPRCVGVAESRKLAEAEVRLAIDELGEFGPAADDLRALARFVVVRNY